MLVTSRILQISRVEHRFLPLVIDNSGQVPPEETHDLRPQVRLGELGEQRLDDPMAVGGELLGETDYESFIADGDPDFEWRYPADEGFNGGASLDLPKRFLMLSRLRR